MTNVSTHAAADSLSYRQILVFWLPLAFTWMMMSFESPILNSIIASLADPKANLAAYGTAFAIAILVESPIILMMSASTALVRNRSSLRRLWKFTAMLNVAITLVMLVMLIPAVYDYLIRDLAGYPQPVADLVKPALLILLPWPAAIGFRRFYQGILISNNLTRRVTYGTFVRLLTMGACAALMYWLYDGPGVMLGAAALTSGVVAEALASRFMVHKSLLRLKQTRLGPDDERLTYREIVRFYTPLALTSIIGLSSIPLVQFFVNHGRLPLDSLAVMSVINPFTFLFVSLGLSYQEAGIALLGKGARNVLKIRRFAIALGLACSIGMLLVAFTPLYDWYFSSFSNLSPALTDFGRLPTKLLVPLPFFAVYLSFLRSVLVNARDTRPISLATMADVALLAVLMAVCVYTLDLVGAIAASLSVVVSRAFSQMMLVPRYRRAISG